MVEQTKKGNSNWSPLAQKILGLLTVFVIVTRLFRINDPAEVVFDEVHFGGFASYYLRHEYFFDVHPPLGKLLIAAVGWLMGYDGGFTFGTIGASYTTTTAPYVAMRSMMAAFGWAAIAFAYATLIEMQVSPIAAGFAAALLVFDNALTVQTRFILLDSPLLAFIAASFYCWTRFRQERHLPFQKDWWLWLLATGASIGCATSVKLVGLFAVASIGLATVVDLWELADWKRKISERMLRRHFAARALALIVLPVAIYLGTYYLHFSLLYRTGPGDGFMSPEFQATLEGNQMHIQSRPVKYGNTIRLKSRLEEIFLHSHKHNYPLRHDDGKISSQGQQVTGYPSEDANNYWKILPLQADRMGEQLRSGDLFRLIHVATGKALYTHDVASPLTRTNMEVTLMDHEDPEKAASTVWQVEIVAGPDRLMTKSCHLKILHNVHKVALTNHQQPLPKWGFGHREINGDKRGQDENSKWIVWEVSDPLELAEAEALQKRRPTRLSFLQKFWELQIASIRTNAKLIDNHPFKSDPISWPWVTRGISFWDKGGEARIYLLGNIVAWYTCLFGLVAFCVISYLGIYRWRRGEEQSATNDQLKLVYRGGFLLVGWLLHYAPFFAMSRTLYVHHYLPAYLLSAMVTGVVVDYALQRAHARKKLALMAVLGVLVYAVAATFWYFYPITYGTYVKTVVLKKKKWLSTWDWP